LFLAPRISFSNRLLQAFQPIYKMQTRGEFSNQTVKKTTIRSKQESALLLGLRPVRLLLQFVYVRSAVRVSDDALSVIITGNTH